MKFSVASEVFVNALKKALVVAGKGRKAAYAGVVSVVADEAGVSVFANDFSKEAIRVAVHGDNATVSECGEVFVDAEGLAKIVPAFAGECCELVIDDCDGKFTVKKRTKVSRIPVVSDANKAAFSFERTGFPAVMERGEKVLSTSCHHLWEALTVTNPFRDKSGNRLLYEGFHVNPAKRRVECVNGFCGIAWPMSAEYFSDKEFTISGEIGDSWKKLCVTVGEKQSGCDVFVDESANWVRFHVSGEELDFDYFAGRVSGEFMDYGELLDGFTEKHERVRFKVDGNELEAISKGYKKLAAGAYKKLPMTIVKTDSGAVFTAFVSSTYTTVDRILGSARSVDSSDSWGVYAFNPDYIHTMCDAMLRKELELCSAGSTGMMVMRTPGDESLENGAAFVLPVRLAPGKDAEIVSAVKEIAGEFNNAA